MKLQSRLIATILPIILFATTLAAIGSIWLQYRQYGERYSHQMETYISERGKREAIRFNRLTEAHQYAGTLFEANYLNLSDAEIEAGFDALFAEAADGSFRSRDAAFDGTFIPNLGKVYGVGAIIPTHHELSANRKRVLYSAAAALIHTAPNYQNDLESLWYLTPYDDVLIFAPERKDKLMFYRETAAGDFSFSSVARFLDNISFETNPEGETLCTPLSRLIYATSGRALTAGCQTPSRIDGVQLGAWGTTLPMEGPFTDAVQDVPMKEAELFFLGSEGELMAHPDYIGKDEITETTVESAIPAAHRSTLMKAFEDTGRQSGVVTCKSDGLLPDIYSFYRIDTPGWFVVNKLSGEFIFADATRGFTPIFLLTLGLIVLTILITTHLINRFGVEPVQRLAETFRRIRNEETKYLSEERIVDLLRRGDELGELPRALTEFHSENIDHVQMLEKRVEERTQDLQRANEAKTIFLANMSHELRTPLNGILGIAGSLRRRVRDEDLKEQVELVEQSATTLERLLTDLLDISKVEAGKLELEAAPFNLQAALKSVIDLHAIAADDKGLKLDIDFAADTEGMFIGDAVRIKQVALNLLSNAIKFTDEGEISLKLQATQIDQDEQLVELAVRDTGAGIPIDFQEAIFDRFSQAATSNYRTHGGTGLGLSIVRSLTELMGGDVRLSSLPGAGSEFVCAFKLQKARPAPTLSTPDVDAAPGAESYGSGISVLLAEDHAVNRRVVELILESQGVNMISVENGRDAFDAFKSRHFDVVLMDIRMPECDGLEAVRLIRAHERRKGLHQTPVIMLTANTSEDDVRASIEAGANTHLGKPVTPEKLLGALISVVSAEPVADTRKSA